MIFISTHWSFQFILFPSKILLTNWIFFASKFFLKPISQFFSPTQADKKLCGKNCELKGKADANNSTLKTDRLKLTRPTKAAVAQQFCSHHGIKSMLSEASISKYSEWAFAQRPREDSMFIFWYFLPFSGLKSFRWLSQFLSSDQLKKTLWKPSESIRFRLWRKLIQTQKAPIPQNYFEHWGCCAEKAAKN